MIRYSPPVFQKTILKMRISGSGTTNYRNENDLLFTAVQAPRMLLRTRISFRIVSYGPHETAGCRCLWYKLWDSSQHCNCPPFESAGRLSTCASQRLQYELGPSLGLQLKAPSTFLKGGALADAEDQGARHQLGSLGAVFGVHRRRDQAPAFKRV